MPRPDRGHRCRARRWPREPARSQLESDGAADVEFAHAGLQGGALHAEDGGSAFGAGDAPFGLAEGAKDVLALGFFESGDGRGGGACGIRRSEDAAVGGDVGGDVADGERGLFQLGERDTEFFAGAEEHGAFDEIFEFADVSRPRIVHERVHRVGGNVQHGFVEAAAEILDEVADEERDVFAAFAQRRNLNRKNVEAIVEVAAKFAVGDEAREVAVGGGDDADVHGLRAIAAEAFEFLLLQNPE